MRATGNRKQDRRRLKDAKLSPARLSFHFRLPEFDFFRCDKMTRCIFPSNSNVNIGIIPAYYSYVKN